MQVLGARLKTGCQSNLRPRGTTGTEPLTPDLVDGNSLLALTAATPLEEKPCAVTGNEPPPRTHVISDDVFGQQLVEKNGCSGVHVVVAKESDVNERMIHTGGEEIHGNETRNVRDWGPRLGENRGGWVGTLDSTSSLRLDKDPR